jgi:hypothetical protein
MLNILNKRIVVTVPAMAPVAKMVIGKNLRPKNATIRPKGIAIRARIKGLFKKKREKVVEEKTGQAIGCEASITGWHGLAESTEDTCKGEAESASVLQCKLSVNL